jgi:hypothetical protein
MNAVTPYSRATYDANSGRTMNEHSMGALEAGAVLLVRVTATPGANLAQPNNRYLPLIPPIPPKEGLRYHGWRDLTYVPVAVYGSEDAIDRDAKLKKGKKGSANSSQQKTTGRKKVAEYSYQDDKKNLDKIFFGRNLVAREDIGQYQIVQGILHEERAIMLVNIGKNTRSHEQIVSYVKNELNDHAVTVIVHNSNSIKLHYPRNHAKALRCEEFSVSANKGEPIIDEATNAVVTPNSISTMLEWLRQEHLSDPTLHNHIVIVAGMKAGRGLSFVSHKYHWHLTHMYMVVSDTMTVQELIQSCGRINGVYEGDNRLVFFGATKLLEDYVNASAATEEINDKLCAFSPTINKVDGKSIHEIFSESQTFCLSNVFPDRPLATPRRAKRMEGSVRFKDLRNQRHSSFHNGIKHAMRVYPDMEVLDFYVALQDVMPEAQTTAIIDAIHRRGPAGSDASTLQHLMALDEVPYVGQGKRTTMMRAIQEQIVQAIAAKEAELVEEFGERFRIPQAYWDGIRIPFGQGSMLRHEEVSLVEPVNTEKGIPQQDRMKDGGYHFRYRNSRRLTKGRNANSGSGEIEYMKAAAFLLFQTPPRVGKKVLMSVQEIPMPENPEFGVVVRLISNEALVKKKMLRQTFKTDADGNTILDKDGVPVMKYNKICGPYLATSTKGVTTAFHDVPVRKHNAQIDFMVPKVKV